MTLAEACGGTHPELPGIFPGSWIDANFSIWIGHADDQRGWSQLADARAALDVAVGANAVGPDDLVNAREEILIAEGSDWFWWYGDDHSSAHDVEFDHLFRAHLRNAYRRLRVPVPDELFGSNISARAWSVRRGVVGRDGPRAGHSAFGSRRERRWVLEILRCSLRGRSEGQRAASGAGGDRADGAGRAVCSPPMAGLRAHFKRASSGWQTPSDGSANRAQACFPNDLRDV